MSGPNIRVVRCEMVEPNGQHVFADPRIVKPLPPSIREDNEIEMNADRNDLLHVAETRRVLWKMYWTAEGHDLARLEARLRSEERDTSSVAVRDEIETRGAVVSDPLNQFLSPLSARGIAVAAGPTKIACSAEWRVPTRRRRERRGARKRWKSSSEKIKKIAIGLPPRTVRSPGAMNDDCCMSGAPDPTGAWAGFFQASQNALIWGDMAEGRSRHVTNEQVFAVSAAPQDFQ